MKRSDEPGLSWGIRRSLVRYIASLDDGMFEVSDGAHASEGDEPEFWFPLAATADSNVAHFVGTVRLEGYGGMLTVILSDPWVMRDPDGPALTVDDGRERIVFARLDDVAVETFDKMQVSRHVAAVLTDDGAYLLGPQYQAGQPVDPLTVVIPLQ